MFSRLVFLFVGASSLLHADCGNELSANSAAKNGCLEIQIPRAMAKVEKAPLLGDVWNELSRIHPGVAAWMVLQMDGVHQIPSRERQAIAQTLARPGFQQGLCGTRGGVKIAVRKQLFGFPAIWAPLIKQEPLVASYGHRPLRRIWVVASQPEDFLKSRLPLLRELGRRFYLQLHSQNPVFKRVELLYRQRMSAIGISTQDWRKIQLALDRKRTSGFSHREIIQVRRKAEQSFLNLRQAWDESRYFAEGLVGFLAEPDRLHEIDPELGQLLEESYGEPRPVETPAIGSSGT